MQDDIEGETNQQRTASSVTRPTSEFTILSSVHGRARRQLRKISRLDLQSAVKYGVKTPGAPCRNTGAPRWVYTYGIIVYVTDETSKKEITSYHQPIVIQEAPITPEMTARHDEDVKIFLEDPHLCVSHLFIVIDQSGSMRTSDVHGFLNRSHAAYGVLLLEYFADQLLQREGGDKVLEAVTVLEMHDDSHVIFHREPLDWILFNKLLHRQRQAVPYSHGDYNMALSRCKTLMRQELQGLEPEDAPIFSVIFLSDGRPSDIDSDDPSLRQELLEIMTSEFKSNFQLHAVGLGKASADFSALKEMITWVRDCGCIATFSFSQLSASQLGGAFSSISSSMTATRTEALSGNRKTTVPRQKKDVKLRSKSTPQDERIYRMETRTVLRLRYTEALDKHTRESLPWVRVPFKNKDTIGFEVEKEPFGRGTERLAYVFHEIGPGHKRLGAAMVAKETTWVGNEYRMVAFHEAFCRVQHKSRELADSFNNAVARTPALHPVDPSIQLPHICFLDCDVYRYTADDGVECGLLVEEFLQGKFIKYSSNNGFVRNPKGSPTIQIPSGEVYLEDFLQAFSHWVYFSSQQKILICDLQGKLDMEGVRPMFVLTDPCICSKREKGEDRLFGLSDMGIWGIRQFRRSHICNGVCKGLGLPAFGSRPA
jgi:Alpha-kinase family